MDNLMKDFEGVKRIQNKLELTIDDLFELLAKYRDQIGRVYVNDAKDRVICDTKGKYCAHVYVQDDKIIVERHADEGEYEEIHDIGESRKSVDMSTADRMIEQIYDFLVDYSDGDGELREYITGVKKVLFVSQQEKRFSDVFYISDVADNNVYEVKNNRITKDYVVRNIESKREEVSINYKEKEHDKFRILKAPYTTIFLSKYDLANKTTFTGTLNSKEIKITADYTDNHFIIELDDIVIGAIDSLNEKYQNNYRLEINNLEYEYLIISINIIMDIYVKEHSDEKEKDIIETYIEAGESV